MRSVLPLLASALLYGGPKWSVTYSPTHICALEGSSVTMSCSYTYPSYLTVTEVFWTNQYSVHSDLSKDAIYKKRVTVDSKNKHRKCSLNMIQLTKADAHYQYYCRITTNVDNQKMTGTGISLKITDLQIVSTTKESVTEGDNVTLTCKTICTLTGSPSFIWSKDGRPVEKKQIIYNQLQLCPVSREDEGNYTCAVKGHEDRSSPPMKINVVCPTVVFSDIEDAKEGDEITLTCNTTCALTGSPSFIWSKDGRPVEKKQIINNQLQLRPISREDEGNYTCAVKGHEDPSSPPMKINVMYPTDAPMEKCEESDIDSKLNQLEQKLSASTPIPPKEVCSLLDSLLEAPQESLASRAEDVLRFTEKLVSRLVEPTHTQSSRTFSTNTTVVETMTIGPDTTLTRVPQIVTEHVSLAVDLLGIAQNSNGSASAVLVVYNSMQEVLNASFFKTVPGQSTTSLSDVISVVLPNTLNKSLPSPVNFTIQHAKSIDEEASCVYWMVSGWVKDGCYVSETNSTHTVCSCTHLSTFALIMTVDQTPEKHPVVDVLNTVFVLIGLVFLTLAVMTFALCRWNPRVSNVARLNLCVCLLLAHPLFLLTQSFLHLIRPHEVLCKMLSGVLHFLFLCCFVWMSIEAVLLFLSVRKLRQVKPNERVGLQWKLSILIGYGIPLVIVSVSAVVKPDGYGSQDCWLQGESGFIWSFVGPVCFILAANIILFLTIFVTIHSTLMEARSDVSKVKYNRVLLFKITVQFVILGCPWILGLLASHSHILDVLFLFLTSQQGTAIFLVHCLFNIEVRRQYRTWWQRFGPSDTPTGSSTGATVTISLTKQPNTAAPPSPIPNTAAPPSPIPNTAAPPSPIPIPVAPPSPIPITAAPHSPIPTQWLHPLKYPMQRHHPLKYQT
ncbi:adhesion G protein-coupled receptor E5-like isoform X2 [Alosa pseudoharengus]|uniref:adhesion G protein-coupled receptor E5-like isoform X2 n=1 Tax=Alosa pseudoharengus TaxID=34774 RepID=UPI003F896F79